MTGREQLVHHVAVNQDGIFLDNSMDTKQRDFLLPAPISDSALFLDHIWVWRDHYKSGYWNSITSEMMNVGDVTAKDQW